MKSTFLSIFIALLLLITELYGAPINGYPVTIEILTTSDWTEINFPNTDFYYFNDTLITNKKNSLVDLGMLSVNKKSFDSTLVHAQFNIFLSSKLTRLINFTIKKGVIGKTDVVIHTQKETLAIFSAVKPENNYKIKRNIFKKNSIQTYHLLQSNKKVEPLVLAFYYPWYERNWMYGDSQLVAHTPINGFYNSGDEKIMLKHILMAKSSGIDGFIISWWGQRSFADKNSKKMLYLSESLGFKISLYLETANSLQDIRNDLNYIETTYTSTSSFLNYEGHPVLFLFSRISDKLAFDSLILTRSPFVLINHGFSYSNLKRFSGFHEYLPLEKDLKTVKWKYLHAAQIANRENKIMAVTVMPGYDDRRIRHPGNFINRDAGLYYKRIWKTALNCKPDWILITSFNEWFEGTEIEPSKKYGDQYLNLTNHYARLFKGKNEK